jgi:hypothetical protein
LPIKVTQVDSLGVVLAPLHNPQPSRFVEEYEKLALALRGSFRQREIALECETVY